MKRFVLVLVLGLLTLLIQGTVIRGLLPHFFVPNLIVILAVFLAFYESSILGCILVFLLGLMLDMSGGVVLGPWAGSMVFIFAVVAVLAQRIFVESPVAVMVTTSICALVANVVHAGLSYQVSRAEFASYGRVFGEAFVTALLCPLLFPLLRKLLAVKTERTGHRRSSYI
jgi:rod shape-determining protein MreD